VRWASEVAFLEALGIGVALGAGGEALARALRLWVYHRPVYPFVNVVGMFGGVMGGLSLLDPELGSAGLFAIGWAIGFGYEWLNFLVLDWWHFPGDRFLVFRGRGACAASVATLWGLVPAANALLRRVL
jgi:hypothetical protein